MDNGYNTHKSLTEMAQCRTTWRNWCLKLRPWTEKLKKKEEDYVMKTSVSESDVGGESKSSQL